MFADGPSGEATRPPSAASLGAQLRGFRTRVGLSQESLAERAGVGVATLKALERNQRQRPHPQTLALLADALGLGPSDRDALLNRTSPGERERASSAVQEARPVPREPSAIEAPRLPAWLTTFIGREAEVEMVRKLLDPTGSDVRLLSLIGPGGVGKTRLAVRAAVDLSQAYPDGVFFVDLAPLSDPLFVPATIARVLGLRESSESSPRDLVLDYLQPRQTLLVLDNFEHVLAAASLLAELVQECSRLAVLTTSRTVLRLRAEQRLRVGPLATPSADGLSVDQIEASPAVRLFVERAQTVSPGFALGPSNASAVAEICRRLDGMPLAIELAAARTALLQPVALLQRLERRLPLLTRGATDLPERQQTLRQTLAWSHALLKPAEQVLFRRLAVFAGGGTLEALEAVCVLDAQLGEDLLDALVALVDASLVYKTVGADDEPRFGMLETVREYGQERLAESEEVEPTRRAHALFYLALAERAGPELRGPGQAVWLERMEREHANVRAALDWLIECDDLHAALRLATAATWYWLRRSYFSDIQRLMLLLGRTQGQRDAVRAKALLAAARLASSQGDYVTQARYAAESMRLFWDLDDEAGAADAITDLGGADWQQGRLDQAQVHLEEGLRLFRSLGDLAGISTALMPLACVARDRADLDAARPLFGEALALRRAAGDQLGMAQVLNNMGWLELYAGDLEAARTLVEQSLAIRRALGSLREVGVSQTLLGVVALVAGERAIAAAQFRDSLSVHRDVGNRWGIALAVEGVAALAAASEPAQSLRLAAAAGAVREAIGRPLPPAEQPLVAGWLAPAQRALSPQRAEWARAGGKSLSEAQSVAEALDLVSSLALD